MIQNLIGAVPPPTVPFEPFRGRWGPIARALGTALPPDYKDFARLYGGGALLDFIYVQTPRTADGGAQFARWVGEICRSWGHMERDTPTIYWPTSGGLLPFGYSMDGDYFFWLTHAPHHHITQLNALKGWVGNPIELFLISLSVLAFLDFGTAALLCAVNIGGVISGFAHANVRSDPPLFYSFVFTTIRHHSLHHTALSYEDTRCNYGNSLILLDRVFGTYREGESSIVGQDERKRLSIYEQFVFPFQPLIDGIKASFG